MTCQRGVCASCGGVSLNTSEVATIKAIGLSSNGGTLKEVSASTGFTVRTIRRILDANPGLFTVNKDRTAENRNVYHLSLAGKRALKAITGSAPRTQVAV